MGWSIINWLYPPASSLWSEGFKTNSMSATFRLPIPQGTWSFLCHPISAGHFSLCRGHITLGALCCVGPGEFALQEHSGNTQSLLLVDGFSQDVVISYRLEACFFKELTQKLWKQTKQQSKTLFRKKESSRRKIWMNKYEELWAEPLHPHRLVTPVKRCYSVFPCCNFCTYSCIIHIINGWNVEELKLRNFTG